MEPPPDISNYSEEEQKVLLGVFAKLHEEDEKTITRFKDEQTNIKILEAAIELRRQEKSNTDIEATCNICYKTKFADGVGHICTDCQIRCCARCGVKVTTKTTKVWLCVVCRKKKELNIKYGKWMTKENNPKTSQWGRSRSLEEQAKTERAGGGMRKDYRSSLNISMASLNPWSDDKKQTPTIRSSPVAPVREETRPAPQQRPAPEFRYDPAPPFSGGGPHSAPIPGGGGNGRRHSRRRSSLDTIRNDSLSSDQSENPPRPPRPSRKGNGHRYRRSGSSGSEDEARSSPSSCQDSESDRDPSTLRAAPEPRRPHAPPRRRFDTGEGLTKDSGIDTSSSVTLCDDLQKHSVNWKRSPDGTLYIGHLVLKKDYLVDRMTRQSLGMRVVGGQRIDSKTIGAIVENIREGELADRIGRIERGDEVLEWNGRRLRGLSKELVAEIISESKPDPQTKLVICRKIGMDVSNPIPPHLEVHPEAMQRGFRQESRYMRYPDRPASSYRTPNATIGGKIQVRLYYDTAKYQLIVTVVCASDLPPRCEGSPRNPYVKIVLLPDKSEKSKRRSKTIASTNDPQWHQSFVYTHLRQSELRNRTLQISVWDYDRKVAFSDFLGEVLIPLRSNLSGESQCYPLSMHREDNRTTSPPLSPTASRMSDEELSDFDDKFSEHTVRRIMAVDSSPPFYDEEHRRRLQQSVVPPSPMAPPEPLAEFPRGRMREPGFGDRRRSRSMAADTASRSGVPGHGSRSVSPPQYRHNFQPLPRPSTSQRLVPPQNSFRKRQLPPVPLSRSDLGERYLKGRTSVVGAPSGVYGGEYDRLPRRGGGSRMAAALGVGAASPLVSPERSDSESSSKFSLSSAFHRNSRTFEEFSGRSSAYGGGPVHPSSREMDGSLSDTAVGLVTESKSLARRSTPTEGAGGGRSSFLSKKSSSTSQLSVTGHKKRLIFRRRNGSSSSFVVQRSEEILPDMRAGSSISSDGSISGDSLTWGSRLPPEIGETASFVEGLGPGQLVGRQALASPSLGEVQLGIQERKNCLEVEVIRARGLLPKPNARVLPAPYVKVYLFNATGDSCFAKQKTATARRTLDPLYQDTLVFKTNFQNCFLQVIVWGNYSSMEKKVFMGVAQIVLDDIDLVTGVLNWYRLFHHSSLVHSLISNNRRSFLSLDSFG